MPRELWVAIEDGYQNKSFGLIGCRATSWSYPVCEYDVLVLGGSRLAISRRLVGSYILDDILVPKESVSHLQDNHLALTLSQLKVIDDPSWSLTPVINELKAERLRKFRLGLAREFLSSALARVGRCREALRQSPDGYDASFWILSAAYECVRAMVAYGGEPPASSHLLSQLKRLNQLAKFPSNWSNFLGLPGASANSVARRLEALGLINSARKRLAEEVNPPADKDRTLIELKLSQKLAEARERHLLSSHLTVEAYSYLGLEVSQQVEDFYRMMCLSEGTPPSYPTMLTELSRPASSGVHISSDLGKLLDLTRETRELEVRTDQIQSLVRTLVGQLSKA